MEKVDATWKIFSAYILILFLMLFAGTTFGQIKVMQFNAAWNSTNDVLWVQKLSDCETISYSDISKDKETVTEKLTQLKKYIDKINKKEKPIDLNNPFTGYC